MLRSITAATMRVDQAFPSAVDGITAVRRGRWLGLTRANLGGTRTKAQANHALVSCLSAVVDPANDDDMKLVDILEPGRVLHRLQAKTRDEVVRELVHRGFVQRENNTELGIADEDRVVRVLLERERMQSTGIKDGLAIPHGKIERLDGVLACLGVAENEIDFGAPDGKKSQIFVALLAPENGAGLHLKALARTSRIFSDPTVAPRILSASSGEELFAILASEDARYG
jgi:PTS system nitrogen regulatory IIA component